MTDTCGQRLPEPLAHWDPDSLCWRTSQPTLFEDSPEWSGTWPTSGMTHGGQLYALPALAPPTLVPDCLPLLKTPTAQLATNGGSQHPDKRRQGGHGPTLADEIEHLLPTPAARDWKTGTSNIMDLNSRPLNEVIVNLPPTPTATDAKGSRNATSGRKSGSQHHDGMTLSDAIWSIGGSGGQPSGGGSESSDDPPLFPTT
jgi:hypothetical protein